MNCVQCGEGLAANAKFCRKCGSQVQAPGLAQAARLPEAVASPRGLPATPVAAYATCPDCGALCTGHAVFCKQCGCRFEETPGFEDTARDWDTPLSVAEEKAILVFGNVQDSSEPPSVLPGERIQTSAAMVIGGTAAMAAAAVPAPALREQDVPLWQPEAAAPRVPPAPAEQTGVRAPRSSASARNPMPEVPVAQGGQGLRIAAVLLALAVLAAGGAWWWKSQQSRPAVAADVVTETAIPAAASTVAPAAMVETDAALAPNETLVAPALALDAVSDTVVAPVEADAPAPAAAPARPAVRKPVRKQTLDDLLN